MSTEASLQAQGGLEEAFRTFFLTILKGVSSHKLSLIISPEQYW